MRGNGGRERDGLENPLMSKQQQQLGPLSEQANGMRFCPQLDCCFSELGTKQSQYGPFFVARWLREDNTGDEVGGPSGGAVHMDGKSW